MDNAFSSVVIESMSDGVVVLDFQGHIIHINPAGLDLLGLRPEEVRDRTYVQLFMDAPENDAFNDILIRGIQERETRLYLEVPFRRGDGRQLDLAVTTSFLRLRPGKGAHGGIVVVFKDITEFKALDRARQRVLDHLSHEVRTPLSIISGSLKRLKTPENQRTIDRIHRNLKRLQDIQGDVEDIVRKQTLDGDDRARPCVEQTLDLLEWLAEETPDHAEAMNAVRKMVEARFPRRTVALRPLRLGPCIEGVTGVIKQRSSHRNIRLVTEIREEPYVLMDTDVFEKVVVSLIKNAIENTPDEGMVQVSLGASSDEAKLMVRDTGVGITEESQKQIFGGFYHARETAFYSTRRPFDFDAGGKGLELLKLRIFADAYGFRAACESNRCVHLSGEDVVCPGAISECPHVKGPAECALSGGTAFTLMFPLTSRDDVG
ncbi:MAG: PAS domain S-box protein [Deltaproteobacteria bacterium]|nr:PAS domain S-box protein [Deltaproteobacteria bacterium]